MFSLALVFAVCVSQIYCNLLNDSISSKESVGTPAKNSASSIAGSLAQHKQSAQLNASASAHS